MAQLGARVTGSHEVAGSTPASSTNIFNNLQGFTPLTYFTGCREGASGHSWESVSQILGH